jgi:hypothetical protein
MAITPGEVSIGAKLGNIFSHARPEPIYSEEYVASHIQAILSGTRPTDDIIKKVVESDGAVWTGHIGNQLPVGEGTEAFDRLRDTASSLLKGVWLKFEDATFETRLKGALAKQDDAIEEFTKAVNAAVNTKETADATVKKLDALITKLDGDIAKAHEQGNSDLEGLLTTRKGVIVGQRASANQVAIDWGQRAQALNNRREALKAKQEGDVAIASTLIAEKRAGKALKNLDKDLRKSLGKMEGLESDIRRIRREGEMNYESAKQAADELNRGGLGAEPNVPENIVDANPTPPSE